MKFFLDTWGIIDSVTTNPSLISLARIHHNVVVEVRTACEEVPVAV